MVKNESLKNSTIMPKIRINIKDRVDKKNESVTNNAGKANYHKPDHIYNSKKMLNYSNEMPGSYLRSDIWENYAKNVEALKTNFKRASSHLKTANGPHYAQEKEFVRQSIDSKLNDAKNAVSFSSGRKRRLSALRKAKNASEQESKSNIQKLDPNSTKKLPTLSPQKEKQGGLKRSDSQTDFENNQHSVEFNDEPKDASQPENGHADHLQ